MHKAVETPSSVIAFGRRGDQDVVLKVVRGPGEEWRSGQVLEAFRGRGMVAVLDQTDGAGLLERLRPGTSLASLALAGRDEEATAILADLIGRMGHPREALDGFASVEVWGRGFDRYVASGDRQVPESLVERARSSYTELCASQRGVRLLHGDLQHYNVLLDSLRGWVAIDPKGVVGEIEYEIGAGLRNPIERPELFASAAAVVKRLEVYEAKLALDAGRILAWGFAQAVLSAIWSVEDGSAVDAENPALMLAHAIWPLLE